MNQQERIDRIIEDIQQQIQSDVSVLLGSPLSFSPPISHVLTKEGCFSQFAGKQVVAQIDIDGEVQGGGALFIDLKSAILLGGTLIMLPEQELDDVVVQANYTEDIADSYGEIANIVVGACSKVFEESYPKSCRFVRKEVVVVNPLRIDVDSDEIIKKSNYYHVVFDVELNGTKLGKMSFALPAGPFGLKEKESVQETGKEDVVLPKANTTNTTNTVNAATTANTGNTEKKNAAQVVESRDENSGEEERVFDQNQKGIDKVLTGSRSAFAKELSLLLGSEVSVVRLESMLLTKGQVLTHLRGNQLIADIEVQGDAEGKAYVCASLADAIYMGGVLVMLPPAELDLVVEAEECDEDTKEAFVEIANLVGKFYTKEFATSSSLHPIFVAGDLHEFSPHSVDVCSDEILCNQYYYQTTIGLFLGEKSLGELHFLINAKDFGLLSSEQIANAEDILESDGALQNKTGAGKSLEPNNLSGAKARGKSKSLCNVLVVSDHEQEALKVAKVAKSQGLSVMCLNYSQNAQRHVSQDLKVICLIMSEVNEQSFGLAIKLSTAASIPLIAAGPGWTKSSVIKAVKYGVDDILLTPAEPNEIEECLLNNIFV